MSPKNDTHLSLCLAQANLSPLHYRHGAIIVRGGKVIGQGFNTYRPGFDGGALKSGILPSASLDGPAIAELKQRLKSKPKNKSKKENKPDERTFTPFESTGYGHNANIALSMHSEMMAIQSALSLSSGTQSSQTSARSTKCFVKPCFRLQGDSKKRKARARGLKAYAKAVCEDAVASAGTVQAYSGEFSIQKSSFEPATSQSVSAGNWQRGQRQGGGQRVSQQGSERERAGEHMEKCRETAIEEETFASLSEWVSRGSEPQSTIRKGVSIVDSESSSSDDDLILSRQSKAKTAKNPSIPTKPQQILITKNKSSGKATIAERTKDLRLKGSDLYVARLGTEQKTSKKHDRSEESELSPPSPIPSKSAPTSLHDELSSQSRSTSLCASKTKPEPFPQPEIRASRPCYRCVSAMHAVGIKRVFWTTHGGEWEMAKVRDLVDALEVGIGGDGKGEGEGLGTGQESKGVFVTKHEVLMLKRAMGF
ncbi:uncharacterized protein RCO7_06725 [Rhynchosporium graminicola]|uniref:Uncharacterized protein n=1 Tax=Rhynchosporium graminicola TaxID=2792576 RepID=A0A1E1JY59_9HELO|nr:uncharacterized protein RCO7_06725 [Rhynchosporium commune]